jgi:hypothetical protein
MAETVCGGRSAVLILVLLALGACDSWRPSRTQTAAPAPEPDPRQLWLVQSVGEDGVRSASRYVCTDAALREAFQRPPARVKGRACEDITAPALKDRAWFVRCLIGAQTFAISASTVGEPSEDFLFDFAVTPIEIYGIGKAGPPVREVRRFRRIGPCPDGWRVGDRAKPGRMPERVRRQGLSPSVRPGMPAASK